MSARMVMSLGWAHSRDGGEKWPSVVSHGNQLFAWCITLGREAVGDLDQELVVVVECEGIAEHIAEAVVAQGLALEAAAAV